MCDSFTWNDDNFKIDCRFFLGEKPCRFKRECKGCNEYSPMSFRICIIKLGAMGDVLRTTPILPALRKKFRYSHITWLVDKQSYDLLKNNLFIDSLMVYSLESIIRLSVESFDWLICLEKEQRAAALTEKIKAKKRSGFGLSPFGTIYPVDEKGIYAYRLGLSDRLKFFENKKTYQEIIFEIIGIPYSKEEYILEIGEEDRKYSEAVYKGLENDHDNILIGICPGAGERFANKAWPKESYIALIRRILDDLGDKHIRVVILGGKREKGINEYISSVVGNSVYTTGTDNSILQFAAIMDRCSVVVCGDTLPMHIAVALKKTVLAIFGPTCEQEIELYGRGKKITTDIDCSPCYKNNCSLNDNCMTAISVEDVYNSLLELLW